MGASAPPFLLPGAHFAVALAFWLAGALGLVWVAGDLALGLFPLPRVAAVTHFFTLGWITTTILAALYQFLPVALAVPIRSTRLAYIGLALYAPGLAVFVWGLIAARHEWMIGGAAAFGTALLIFCGNLAATLKRAPERNLTWWALLGAGIFLLVTVVLGVSLAGNVRWSYLGAQRFLAVGVHLHVALFGWVGLVVVGVAHRLLPMFLLSHGAPEWPGRLAVGMLGGGVALLVALHHALTPLVLWSVAGLVALGMAAFVLQAALFLRHKRKPTLDPGLRLAAFGIGFFVLGLALAPFALHRGLASPTLLTAYVTALVGGFSLFVAGHYYKILPFLVWFHRFGSLVGKRPVPRVVDLYARWPAEAAAGLLGAGAMGLVAAIGTSATWLGLPSALLFAAGAVVVVVQMFLISLRRPE